MGSQLQAIIFSARKKPPSTSNYRLYAHPTMHIDPRITRALLESLRDFETALLANTINCLDSTPAEEWYMGGSIQSVTPTLGPTVGIALTCCADTSSPGNIPDIDGYWQHLEQMSEIGLPIVWVVKACGSRPDHECIIGDGMAKTLNSVGCVGLVTDGGVRDIKGLLNVPFAAYCRGKTIHHTGLRFSRLNEPVEIGGIMINTGDVIHADSEGVIRIPLAALPHLSERAIQMRAFEHHVHMILRQTGLPLAEKRQAVTNAITTYELNSPCLSPGQNSAKTKE